jgi:hypothetical protein
MGKDIIYIVFYSDTYPSQLLSCAIEHTDTRYYCLQQVDLTNGISYEFDMSHHYSFWLEPDFNKLMKKAQTISKEKFDMLWSLYAERD